MTHHSDLIGKYIRPHIFFYIQNCQNYLTVDCTYNLYLTQWQKRQKLYEWCWWVTNVTISWVLKITVPLPRPALHRHCPPRPVLHCSGRTARISSRDQGPSAGDPVLGTTGVHVIRSIHRVNPPVLITAFVICPLPGHWLLPNCARPGLTFNTATLAHSSPGPATAAALRQSAPELRGGHISAVRCPHTGYSYSYSYS